MKAQFAPWALRAFGRRGVQMRQVGLQTIASAGGPSPERAIRARFGPRSAEQQSAGANFPPSPASKPTQYS
jgi:hypothetical protein